jgi:lathosterol oxidase
VTVPWFLFEVKGYSKLYHDYPSSFATFALEMLGFLMFTDFGVYWIHRFEHHPALYSWLHKPHHSWKISTPFAAFAFHPLVRPMRSESFSNINDS